MAVSEKIAGPVVQYIETTGQALGIALEHIKQAEEHKKQASAVVPEVVNLLLTHKIIAEGEKQAAQTQLADHADALQVFANVVEHLTAKHAKELRELGAKQAALVQGHPVGEPRTARIADDDPDVALVRNVPALAHLVSNH